MKESWYRKMFSPSPSDEPAPEQPNALEADLDAQNNRGVLHSIGAGFPQAFPIALECFRNAADQGHALAQNNLALMYSLGLGIPRDVAQATKWFRRSADQGDPAAQFNLGVQCIRESMEVLPDGGQEAQIEAFKWFQLAANQGYWKADVSRERVNLQMCQADVEEAMRRVAAFVGCKEKAPE